MTRDFSPKKQSRIPISKLPYAPEACAVYIAALDHEREIAEKQLKEKGLISICENERKKEVK